VTAHRVQWVSPSPSWSATLNQGLDPVNQSQRMRAPAVLRFEQDRFMDELARTLAVDPSTLDANRAVPVSYRLPAPGESAAPPPTELKLYQAAHGHFYLVAASLTCRLPGLPDHSVDPTANERVAFVLRRRDDDGSEWAWTSDPADPTAPAARTWTQVEPSALGRVAAGEDLRPLFPVAFQSGEQPRRIYVGLIPTSSTEAFKAVGKLSPLAAPGSGAGAPPADPRAAALTTKVTDPLRALATAPMTAPADVTDPSRAHAIVSAEVAQLVEASRFLLVDFADFLTTFAPDLWAALGSRTRPRDPAVAALYDALSTKRADATVNTHWREAVLAAWRSAAVLYGDAAGSLPPALNLARSELSGDDLDKLVAALPATPSTPSAGDTGVITSIQGDSVPPPQAPKLDARGSWHYWIRCAYLRPQCPRPQDEVVSDPTDRFQIAGFFDLDAPSRAIHISLPIDTGIRDLRKLRKNVNFMISNQLRAQMNRVTSLNDALKGQFADGGSFDVGLMCSFSIPIITICALLVLMIFVQLLNIVFWWLPFLRICLPISLESDS
jgi:hypothetical protein